MSSKINPPSLNKTKNYERFKQELLAWREITDLTKNKQGIAIALSLPEEHETQIRDKVFDQLSVEELKSENGLSILIKFLDKHLGKDDLTDSLQKFDEFEDFHRADGQSVHEYVEIFDSKYRKIEKKNMTLPNEILAFKLLKRANITKEEKLLILTGMNYDNKSTLYEEARKSLKKFKGDTSGSSPRASIKVQPAYLAENEEALLAAGYVKSKINNRFNNGRARWEQGGYGGRGGYDGRSGYGRGSFDGQSGYGRGSFDGWSGYGRGSFDGRSGNDGRDGFASFQRTNSKVSNNKKMNPLGADGRTLTCKSCGSFRHLVANCPDSWENMAKANISEDEHAVLFTGYKRGDVSQLEIDARNCAVLDSACSSTVCGKNWFSNYVNSLDQKDRDEISNINGTKTFKFGGGTRLKSEGEFSIPAVIAGKHVTIKTDVVDSDIPLLLSRKAMKNVGMKIDLENDIANIFGQDVALNLTSSGHYCIPIDKTDQIPVDTICAVKLGDNGENRVDEGKNRVDKGENRVDEGENRVEEGVNRVDEGEDRVEGDNIVDTGGNKVEEGDNRVDKGGNKVEEGKNRVGECDNRVDKGDDRVDKAGNRVEDGNNGNDKGKHTAGDDSSNTHVATTSTVADCDISFAKESELKKLRLFNTYNEVKNDGQSTLSTRWVITNKNGQVKARLVVRGFEEEFILPRDSPTVGKGAMRIVLTIISSQKWIVKTTDIKSAFLQGKEIDRDVYIRPPIESGTPPGIIWKLKHGLPVYGLKDGARQFFMSVKEELLKLGFKQCTLDPAIFYFHREGKLSGIICCHVDDFLNAGGAYYDSLMNKLRQRLYAGKVEENNFTYIGFTVKQNENEITLDQSNYMEKLQCPVSDICNRYSDLKVVVFTEASLGNINAGTRSTGAHILWLVDNAGRCCPLAWHASKIKRVVSSTIAAEAMSLQEGLESSFYYRRMIEEIIGLPQTSISITAHIDNKSVIEAVLSTKLVDDKRLRVDIAAIREFMELNDINQLRWCSVQDQIANCMTKQGASGYQLLRVLQSGRIPRNF